MLGMNLSWSFVSSDPEVDLILFRVMVYLDPLLRVFGGNLRVSVSPEMLLPVMIFGSDETWALPDCSGSLNEMARESELVATAVVSGLVPVTLSLPPVLLPD